VRPNFLVVRNKRVSSMKRAKDKTSAKTSNKASSGRKGAQKAVDLAAIRQQIANLVGNDAIGMVETTIEEVGKGHYLGMKYLFELVGLYPATTGGDGALVSDSMAATLLRRLGLPEAPLPEEKVTKDVETPTTVSDDGLE
jgi:hypothetical protein